MNWAEAKDLARLSWGQPPFLKFRIREGLKIEYSFSVGYMKGEMPFICGRGDSWVTAFANAGVIVTKFTGPKS